MKTITPAIKRKYKCRPPSKHELCLIELLKAGLPGISKLTMIKAYGETSLPTTISELGLQRGINIHRESRPHKHQNGGDTHFNWYWLPSRFEALKVIFLIYRLRAQRRAESFAIGSQEFSQWLKQFPCKTGHG